MNALNVEIKAHCSRPERIRELLKQKNASFIGTDHQIDTYFQTAKGRLKLRQGNIENALIYYERDDKQGPKSSQVKLYKPRDNESLHHLLSHALDVQIVVDKQREIYFIDNVKFHIDRVKGLGNFVEIEAIDEDGSHSMDQLQAQCDHYISLFEIREQDLLANSYSDLLSTTQEKII